MIDRHDVICLHKIMDIDGLRMAPDAGTYVDCKIFGKAKTSVWFLIDKVTKLFVPVSRSF